MPNVITARPDNGPVQTGATTPAHDDGRLQAAWDTVAGWTNAVPTWTWVIAIATLTIATILCVPMLRAQAFRAGTRSGKKTLTPEDRKDRRLLIAALIPAGLFWVAVLAGSARGLVAFGRDDLRWTSGWEWLVPATLDGVAISFTLLAFRAVRKNLNPDRALRIAGLAMLASAGINFIHEVGGSKLGAAYLAVLSLLGAFIVDELLAQFEQGADNVARKHPKFGLRWATWPTNTFCAWIAWRNHPVDKDDVVRVTIRMAVDHLADVRAKKAAERAARVDKPTWAERINPLLRSAQLRTALAEQRTATAAEQALAAERSAEVEQLQNTYRSDLAALTERLKTTTEQVHSEATEQYQRVQSERNEQLRDLRSGYETELELLRKETEHRLLQLRTEHGAELAKLQAERDTEVARLRAELSKKVVPITRSAGTNRKTGPGAPLPARSSDTEALHSMFTEHPDRGYEWTDREVNRITGAGFSSRAPRLTGMASQHQRDCPEQSHKTCYSERSGSGSDDSKEQAS